MKKRSHRQDAKTPRRSEEKKGFRSIDKTLRLGVLAVIGLVVPCQAQTLTNAAASAVPLANLQGSARDMGMGSAFVGVADDPSALFFNCAGLSGLKSPEAALHHNSYLAGTFEETLTAGFPAGAAGGFGLALNYINWGSLDLRDTSGNSQGSFNDTDVSLTAAWGKEWTPGFSAGIALRALQQKVVNDLYTSLAGDLGVLWSPSKDLRFGLAYSNLGTPVAGSGLTGELKGGLSVAFDLGGKARMLAALSAVRISSGLAVGQAGGELTLEGKWSLRAGYQLPFFDNQLGGFANLSAGAGAFLDPLRLDYAFLPFGTLGASHRVSLAYEFDLPKEVVKVAVPVTVIQTAGDPPDAKDLEVHFKIANDPLAEGQELEKAGKANEASRVYVAGLKEDPNSDLLWSALARLYYRSGKKKYAILCFEKVLKLKPDNPALREWLEKYKNQ